MTFFFTALFVVLVFWRPQEWLMPWLFGLPILDAIVYISLLGLLLEVDQGRLRFPRRAPQVYLLIGLWFAAIFSHVPNTYFAGIMETMPEVFKICFFTLLLLCVLDRPSRLRTVAFLFVAMSCMMAVHAIMQERTGYGFAWRSPLYIPAIEGKAPHTRSVFFGIFEDPNDLAQVLATSIPLAFAITRRRTIFSLILGCAVTWLLVRGLMTTHSRGGYVALATVGAVMFVLILPPKWFPTLMVCLLLGAMMLCPLSAGYLDVSAHDRVVFWGMANQMFKQNILFGIGYGMFWQVASDRSAHNAFVSCYTTLGVFGYWFWYVLLQLGVMGAWRTRTALAVPENAEEAWLKRFAGLSIAAMGGFVASGYFLSRAFVFPLFFLFALLGALPVVAGNYLPEEHPPLIRAGRDVGLFGSLGTLASIVYIYFSIVLLNKAYYG